MSSAHLFPEELKANHDNRTLAAMFCVKCQLSGSLHCQKECLIRNQNLYRTIARVPIVRYTASQEVARRVVRR